MTQSTTPRPDDLARRAGAAMQSRLAASAAAYRRRDFLRSFHRLSSETIAAETTEAARVVLREIERALRAERARAGHWTYDLDRHMSLVVAHRSEQERAERLARAERVARRSL
jgi:hypothetical protein